MNKLTQGLQWIIKLLEEHKIPYQITGGLAAHYYGATRAINDIDIDIDIPAECFQRLEKMTEPYINFGPARYKDACWDVSLLSLNFKGQEIDLCGIERAWLYNVNNTGWELLVTDLTLAVRGELFGMHAQIIGKQELIEYKKKIRREVDEKDLEMLCCERSKEYKDVL